MLDFLVSLGGVAAGFYVTRFGLDLIMGERD